MSTTTPVARSKAWMDRGGVLFHQAVDRLDDSALDLPTALPDWTRRHVLAHVASNAEAIGRLATWARTGRESPMYASVQQRADDIAQGATLPAEQLRERVRATAAALDTELDSLDDQAWQAEVVTAQGRTVPATELPWMRAREVAIHAVDLDAGIGFPDLPHGFCLDLIDDVVTRRSAVADGPAATLSASDADRSWSVAGHGDPVPVRATTADLARWLTGRTGGGSFPVLPRWL